MMNCQHLRITKEMSQTVPINFQKHKDDSTLRFTHGCWPICRLVQVYPYAVIDRMFVKVERVRKAKQSEYEYNYRPINQLSCISQVNNNLIFPFSSINVIIFRFLLFSGFLWGGWGGFRRN